MHEYRFAMPGQHDIGIARQISPMQSKTISKTMNDAPDNNLRARILAADRCHAPPPLFRSQRVHGYAAKSRGKSPMSRKRFPSTRTVKSSFAVSSPTS